MTKQMDGLLLSPFNISDMIDELSVDAGFEVSGTEEDNGLKIAVSYPRSKFDVADIKDMLRRYQLLLESVVSNPEARISELLKPLSGDAEAA